VPILANMTELFGKSELFSVDKMQRRRRSENSQTGKVSMAEL